MRRNETSLQKVTDLWCKRIYDLGCKWFCKLENKQNPDLSPWDRGGRPLKRRFCREKWSVLIGRDSLVLSCCGHNELKV
jgi:hypothetical protein